MKIGSGFTVVPGYFVARSLQYFQCVVAFFPLSRPACASSNAPVQTDPMRLVSAPGEETGFTQYECSGADRHDMAYLFRFGLNPFYQSRVPRRLAVAAAGNEENVGLRTV